MEIQEFVNSAESLRAVLLRQAKHYLGDGSDAEDAVQETLLKLWTACERIADATKMQHMASVVCRNVSLNMLRDARCKVQHVTPKALFVVDGKEYNGSINDIKPGDINSINVYKAGSDVANSYGVKGKNGVVRIFTKASKENISYEVDGKPATSQEVKDIAPSKISNVVVLKRGSKAAMDYGEIGKTHDICIIKTK